MGDGPVIPPLQQGAFWPWSCNAAEASRRVARETLTCNDLPVSNVVWQLTTEGKVSAVYSADMVIASTHKFAVSGRQRYRPPVRLAGSMYGSFRQVAPWQKWLFDCYRPVPQVRDVAGISRLREAHPVRRVRRRPEQ